MANGVFSFCIGTFKNLGTLNFFTCKISDKTNKNHKNAKEHMKNIHEGGDELSNELRFTKLIHSRKSHFLKKTENFEVINFGVLS